MSIFQHVLVRKPGRSMFNLTHERKFSASWGILYPILCTELVPGDTFKVATEVFVRTAPLVAPIMHRVNVKVNYFFVPNRLLWSQWEDFITGIDQTKTYDPTDPEDYFVNEIPPYANFQDGSDVRAYLGDGSLADFLGFPTLNPTDTPAVSSQAPIKVQTLPFKAYQKIYNDWFRNQNVEAEVDIPLFSGLSTNRDIFLLRTRMWEKDYFTSALPFSQRGDAVNIPIARVEYNPNGKTTLRSESGDNFNPASRSATLSANNQTNQDETRFSANNTSSTRENLNVDNAENLKVIAGTINDLRIATRLQKWLEINSRVGGRYIEQILGHFGVHSSDARLQRAEYLGGWSCPIIVEPIDQTSATLGDSQSGTNTPQGNQAGKGTAYNNGKPIKCFAEEHGFLIGILSIIPRTSYQDGLPKMFQRNYKEDYYFPEFANLGEQEVNKAEVYFGYTNANNRTFERFGFQERFCEYKYIPSTVHGEFKNNLQFWHLGRAFSTQPVLNKSFVQCSPRTNIFAVEEDVNHFYINLINHVKALRPMPKQAIPSL